MIQPSKLATAVALATLAMTSNAVQAADSWGRLPATERNAATSAGIQVITDYGDWLWVRGDAAVLASRGAEAVSGAATFELDLGGERFDPLQRYPDSLAGIARDVEPSLHLIQMTGPTRSAWLANLRTRGVEPVQYIPPFTYVVWSSGSALAQAAAANGAVRWAGRFEANWRTDERLRQAAGPTPSTVMLYRPAAIDDAALQLASGVAVTERGNAGPDFDLVSMTLDSDALERVLAVRGVYSVQTIPTDGGLRGEVSASISAGLLNGSGVPVPGYLPWLAGVGYDGAGVIMANVDGGIHDTHPVLVNRMLPCTGSSCGLTAQDPHGTHTAGAMAGDASDGELANGFLRGMGIAPAANLIEQRYTPTYTQAGGMLRLMTQSFQNNAVLSSNSWGPSGTPRGYDANTRQVDVGTRDTDPDTAGDQPLTYVLSIMNGFGGVSSQGSPDEAKNVITVGSTGSELPAGVPLTTIGNVSANSGHGPARDGRMIPHLVAPGCSTDGPTSATGYGLNCGTSMATPIVAGSIGLFTQYYRGRFDANPSAALSKVALLASVQNLFGGLDADNVALTQRPNSQQGWGRLRIDRLLTGAANNWYYDQRTVFEDTGDTFSVTLTPVDPSQPVTVMMAYSDAPGHGLGGTTPAWNNDLDLSVVSDGVSYRGNVFAADGYSTSGGSADARNNAEGVVLQSSQLGDNVVITVSATSINSKALPNLASLLNQDFALVCTNCAEVTAPQPDLLFNNGFDSNAVDLIFRNGFDSSAPP